MSLPASSARVRNWMRRIDHVHGIDFVLPITDDSQSPTSGSLDQSRQDVWIAVAPNQMRTQRACVQCT